ncbi:MAG: tetratricopeptide repeat protein [Heliobacteriaceae bacterium]|jgi:tetratricopeptide (TPR) repeat protein|nr:tetratricopeptide repeat protein [Heliobacteriaceae bacterium]
MNSKQFLASAIIIASILASPAYAKELQAQVQKSQTPAAKSQPVNYKNIENWLEYNEYAQADKAIKEALAKNPDDIQALALRTVSMARQHKLTPAQDELNKLLKKYPNNSRLHYAQGMVYMNRQTSSDVDYIRDTRNLINNAIKEFVAAVNIDNNYYQAYNAMGVATLKFGNKNDAVELFNTAIKINPNYANAYDNLGVVEFTDGNLNGAENYYKQALKLNTHNPTSMYHMGQVEAARGNLSGALTWINHSVHIQPSSSPGWNLQGELYLKQGNQAAAINSFHKAILVKPENTRPYINLANVYENRTDEEFAMEQLKTVLAINPGFQEGKMRVADLSLQTRKFEQAERFYSNLLDDSEYGGRAITGLANTYYEWAKETADSSNFTTNKEAYLAYDYINKAVERTPDDLKLHLAKIKLGSITHQPAPSKESLDYIIQNAGSNLKDSVLKGEAYLALGRQNEAVYTFENAVNFSDNLDDDLYMAEILVQHKQFRTARLALQKVLMKDSGNQIAINGVAYINMCEKKSNDFFDVANREFKEGNWASTIEYCNRAIDFYHNRPPIARLKAMAYEKELNYQGAAKYYTEYLSMEPNAPDKTEIIKKINEFSNKPPETRRY